MVTRKRLLIWGKTYPEFSKKYYETVCTGAVDHDTGRLLRIYPITLRHMSEPIRLFDWIEADVERNTSDFRPESHKIHQHTITKIGHLDTNKKDWLERVKWVLGKDNVFASVRAIQEAEARDHTSLGLVRPKVIRRIYMRHKKDEERQEWEEHREAAIAQKDLFVDVESKTQDLRFCPVEYRIKFVCDDAACPTEHDFAVLDWGLYVLNMKQFWERGGAMATQKSIEALQRHLDAEKHEPYFFLGNSKAHCTRFSIVAFFCPPRPKPPAQGMLPGLF